MTTILLANGTQLTLAHAPLPPVVQWTNRTTALLSIDGTQLTLALKQRDHLGASADLAGTVLESESFTLLLVLACVAHQQRLPTLPDLGLLHGVASQIADQVVTDDTGAAAPGRRACRCDRGAGGGRGGAGHPGGALEQHAHARRGSNPTSPCSTV